MKLNVAAIILDSREDTVKQASLLSPKCELGSLSWGGEARSERSEGSGTLWGPTRASVAKQLTSGVLSVYHV